MKTSGIRRFCVKRFLIFSLAVVLSISFAACGGDSAEAKSPATAPVGTDGDSGEVKVSVPVSGNTNTAVQNIPYDGFWDEHAEITILDLIKYYPDGLPFLRNEIYARYGRPFTNKVYQDYFGAKPWYHPRSDYSDAMLSAADKANAELILSAESPKHEDAVATVMKNIEYRGGSAILTFTSTTRLVWIDTDIDFGMYGINNSAGDRMDWLVMGEWVLVYDWDWDNPYSFVVAAYKLDHGAKTIIKSVSGSVFADFVSDLIENQRRNM
jgi:hypothetical protein